MFLVSLLIRKNLMENRLATLLGTTGNIFMRKCSWHKATPSPSAKRWTRWWLSFINKPSRSISFRLPSLPLRCLPQMARIKSHAHAQISPAKVGGTSATDQGAQGLPPPSRDLPRVVGGLLLPLKRSQNAKRHQQRHERCQLLAATVPSSPLDPSCVSVVKCCESIQG